MSVETHHPSLGPARRHRRHAASQDRLARRVRRRRLAARADPRTWPVASARTHGVQGHAATQRARDRRGDRERRRRPQRRDRRRADRLFRACSGGGRRTRARHSRRHSHATARSTPHELEREKDVILQEIGAVEDAPDDLVFDLFSARRPGPGSRSAARFSARRETRRRLRPHCDPWLSAAATIAPARRRGRRRRASSMPRSSS